MSIFSRADPEKESVDPAEAAYSLLLDTASSAIGDLEKTVHAQNKVPSQQRQRVEILAARLMGYSNSLK